MASNPSFPAVSEADAATVALRAAARTAVLDSLDRARRMARAKKEPLTFDLFIQALNGDLEHDLKTLETAGEPPPITG